MTKLINRSDLKEFLDEKYDLYNRPNFIESDPISIPHRFILKEDREIAGFLAATISWGQRITIINNSNKLMKFMGESPYDFVMNAKKKDLEKIRTFVHRTFNGEDALFFILSLQNIYKKHGGLEHVFEIKGAKKGEECYIAIMNFRRLFFSIDHPQRVAKHVSDPSRNSAAKRLCMYLRWMVRNDDRGVDFGLWSKGKTGLLPAHLMCPLDVHTGNVGRKLGLLSRKQDDWKAVVELTESLRRLDPVDPIKYDIALFGLGVFEKF